MDGSDSTRRHPFTGRLPTRRLPTRRRLLGGLVGVPVTAVLYGCSTDDAAPTSTTDASGRGTPGAAGAASTSGVSGAEPPTTVPPESGWASGGTELITVDYPETSIFATATPCRLRPTSPVMEGPCYFQTDTGDDISGGRTGLPMQLCVQLVDLECRPLEGHTIEVWHCDTRGIYSGDTSHSDDAARFAGSMCTFDDAEALGSDFFRGQATTDADGRVNFRTIFPGWYAGRTIHVHFAVTDPAGVKRLISQWCYPDELTEDICTIHDHYKDRGIQDTTLASGADMVFPPDTEPFLLNTRTNSDGSLLSYGVIQIDPAGAT